MLRLHRINNILIHYRYIAAAMSAAVLSSHRGEMKLLNVLLSLWGSTPMAPSPSFSSPDVVSLSPGPSRD